MLETVSPTPLFSPYTNNSDEFNSLTFKLKDFTKIEKKEIRKIVTPLESFQIKIADNVKKYIEPDEPKPGEDEFILPNQ